MLKSVLKKEALNPESLEEAQLIIEKVCEAVRDMAARMKELKGQIQRGSAISSQPPSQDSPKQRASRKKKKPTRWKQGALPGTRNISAH